MQGKTIGTILIGCAAVVDLLVALVMFIPVLEPGGGRSMGAAVLGYALFTIVLVVPAFAAGIFLMRRGGEEEKSAAAGKKLRKLLDMVKSHGQVGIEELVLELDSSRNDVQDMIYDLVGRGLFAGYINWDEGRLYSEQASQLRELTHCQHCTGQLQLAGKGVIRCPYCGTEYFL